MVGRAVNSAGEEELVRFRSVVVCMQEEGRTQFVEDMPCCRVATTSSSGVYNESKSFRSARFGSPARFARYSFPSFFILPFQASSLVEMQSFILLVLSTTTFLHYASAMDVTWKTWVPAYPERLCRTDQRTPEELKRDGGFTTRADRSGSAPNWVWITHILPTATEEGQDDPDDPYVSTSSDFDYCRRLLEEDDVDFVYTLTPGPDFISAEATFGDLNGHYWEKEWTHRGLLPWQRVRSWQEYRNRQPVGEEQPNPDFDSTLLGQQATLYDFAKGLPWNVQERYVGPFGFHLPADQHSLETTDPRVDPLNIRIRDERAARRTQGTHAGPSGSGSSRNTGTTPTVHSQENPATHGQGGPPPPRPSPLPSVRSLYPHNRKTPTGQVRTPSAGFAAHKKSRQSSSKSAPSAKSGPKSRTNAAKPFKA